MDIICEKDKCCGCGLCSTQCPSRAITMGEDSEGFRYPVIDKGKCISCERCVLLCPVRKYNDCMLEKSLMTPSEPHVKAYAAYKKDWTELVKSSAGGVANAIGRVIIERGGTVFGVRYKSDYRGAEYAAAYDYGELETFNESKYVESDRKFLFGNIEAELAKGVDVLVIGLPCDIAAIRSLVGYRENLYTCRLICRSNTSNKALNDFMNNCEKNSGSVISKISLRYKEKGRPTLPTRYRIEFNNGTIRMDDFTKSDYGKAFQILARPSCLSCFAKKQKIDADLIIGDYQGLNPNDDLYKINGLSIVYCMTEKGKKLLVETHSLNLIEQDLEKTWKYNWMISTAIPESPYRRVFSRRFIQWGLRYACHELCKEQNDFLNKLQEEFIKEKKPVAIWGAGDTAEYLYDRLEMDKWNIVKVFDGSPMKHGKFFKGHVIEDFKNVGSFKNEIDTMVLMIPSENESKLEKIAIDNGYSGRIIHVGKYKFYREEE